MPARVTDESTKAAATHGATNIRATTRVAPTATLAIAYREGGVVPFFLS
ncbi:MAG: hypothetical protein ACUVTH_06140 [Thermogutta sp.]